jgi:hypothetical protein
LFSHRARGSPMFIESSPGPNNSTYQQEYCMLMCRRDTRSDH